MMVIRRIAFFVIGMLLVVAPAFVRSNLLGYNDRPYAPAEVPTLSVAATPVPTEVPVVAGSNQVRSTESMRPGPVIVDFAHGNRLDRGQFEPLASALAQRGIGMRFWLSEIDILALDSFLDYPDQSRELGPLLEDASALVVASPFFLWSEQEIRLVERFVADGGRLLLISDPDVLGDLAQDMNVLGEPFGVVFHDDYLYDTSQNDGNYVYVFQGQFQAEAANLADSDVVFYGARSISGDTSPLIQTRDSVLSSVRTGITELTTVATGGVEARGTAGRVLAMGDFHVLTTPYLDRHDNAQMVDFVASFLASAQRVDTVTDFPAYLGREVALVFGHAEAVDAAVLEEGAQVQKSLEETGRTLSLAGASMLSASLAGETEIDLIVLADYKTADETAENTNSLLHNIGFQLVEVTATSTPISETIPTPTQTPTASATPTATSTPTAAELATATSTESPVDADSDATVGAEPVATIEPTTETPPPATFTPTSTPTPTPAPTSSPTPTLTPTPEVIVYLETDDGLRLLARETVLIAQQELGLGHRLVAVLGDDSAGIRAGVERLLMDEYEGCVTDVALVVCSFAEGANGEPRNGVEATTTPTAAATAEETPDGEATQVPERTPTPLVPPDATILLVDDDLGAAENEESEAEIYLQTLTESGYQPTLWTISSDGSPSADVLLDHTWVIWSSGGYEAGGPNLNQLDALLNYINNGGHLTISSRRPFFGMSPEDPTVIADVVTAEGLPAMIQGLPEGPVELPNGLPPVVPLETSEDDEGPRVGLRRGPNSGNPGAPLLFLATDENEEEPVGAQLMILGMSLNWLPEDYRNQLVENMAGVMLEESQN